MNRTSKTIATMFTLAALAAAPIALAQNEPGAKPPAASENMQDMMKDGGTGMMPMMNMMTQMNDMMGACTKMMQAMMPTTDTAPKDGKQPDKG
ncbi:hypothetical protein BLJAPNOD_05251 [Ensifer sp. M14]|uniref:Uncharacterized protein n=1 Tax=Sinorhizobium sp. M14 TaxID=430451 RepID=A0A142BPN8_9HYPH|nr:MULTISPECIES: hypothetical protein [Sinorhizobium/Ensifer group]AMP35046.1 hypothetical protein pSinB_187 [Sinorhizobium sp. M14]RDL48024.1 hypothetical protein BLJAPNOD_05251 [Ensifer sp. M14]